MDEVLKAYITLSPTECLYIATCDMPAAPETPGFKRISHAASAGEGLEVSAAELFAHTPLLFRAIKENGYGLRRPIQEYFEGMGEGSHNQRLYGLFAEKLPKLRTIDRDKYEEFLEHVSRCSVRLGHYDSGFEVWSPCGVRNESIKTGRLSINDGDWFAVHSKQAIRKLGEKDKEILAELKQLPDLWSGVLG